MGTRGGGLGPGVGAWMDRGCGLEARPLAGPAWRRPLVAGPARERSLEAGPESRVGGVSPARLRLLVPDPNPGGGQSGAWAGP